MSTKKINTGNSRFVYDLAPIGICVVNKGNATPKVIYANKAFITLLNAASLQNGETIILDDIEGQTLSKVWPNDKIKKIIKIIKNNEIVPGIDIQLSAKSIIKDSPEKQRWVRLTLSNTVFEGKDCCVIWAIDITENKRAEAKMKHAAIEAEAMVEMKSDFLATMSHEIRTPMQSVYGLLELMAEEDLNNNVQSMISTARTSASGLLEILDDILDLAKVDAGKMELDIFEVPVRTLAYGILECMEIKVHGKDIELKPNITEDVPFVVMGDPTRLRQILLNLVGNALKFTEKGSITLRISQDVKHIKAEKDKLALRFEVIDTGIGMSQDIADKLFQPFIQADSSTTRKYGGTGLGLSISHKLIELMGGKIGVDSEEGKGSTFWFEIPTEAAGDESATELPSLDGLAILSVEDHPQGAKEIVKTLKMMGAEIASCPTYAEGLELAKKRPFDVAVIDQGLPDGLGIDLMKEVSKIRPFMGLILYTVRDDIGLQHSTKTIGAKYLSKPASRVGLGEAVKAAARQAPAMEIEGPKKLLIAEDTLAVQDVLRRQLEKLGVEADFVENGAQALKALEKGEHGILFTDLHMPEIDGYQVVAKIRETEEENNSKKRFPVIVLTADVQLAQKQSYLAFGFDECLLKPVTLGQFRQLLIRWGLLKEEIEKDQTTPLAEEKETHENVLTDNRPPAIDQNAIIEQMGELDEDTIEMMHMFIEMTEPVLKKLYTAFQEKNLKELAEAAHSLKGAARSACCPVLGNLAAEIQDRAENNNQDNEHLIQDMKNEFERVKLAIEDLKIN